MNILKKDETVIAFWVEGHQEIQEFIDQVKNELGEDNESKLMDFSVVHGWTTKRTGDENYDYFIGFSEELDEESEDSEKTTYLFI